MGHTDDERAARLGGHLGRGVLLSFLLHGSILCPVLVLAIVLGKRQAALRDDEIEVRFEPTSTAELPDDAPALERPPPARKPNPAQRPPELARIEEREPEPELPPPEEIPPRARPKPEERSQKMVDLDLGQEVEPPADAQYLAQKHNRTAEETRATATNLEREQAGVEPAGDTRERIAELEDQASQRGRSAPRVTPHLDPEMSKAEREPPPKSLLAIRDTPRRHHEITPETADPSLARDQDGLRPLAEDRPDSVRDLASRHGARRPRLSLSAEQYQYLFGEDAEAATRLAHKEKSKRKGRFAERTERIQSALENFIPEVRPGNQTALNTRAAPFAAFITSMHRSIHKYWGFGFLEDLDLKPGSSPLNDPALMTKLELVMNGDGTVDKVTVVRSSGFLPFDVAAIDSVYSASPFPDPPRAIRSGNGKIYVHWEFHRDERQCATSGVDYFILDNAPAGGDQGEPEAAAGLPTPGRQLSGPRRLTRGDAEPTPEPDPVAARRALEQVVRADDPAARAVAESWFHALARGDVERMLGQAEFPFRSSGGVAARNTAELRRGFSDLVREVAAARAPRTLRLHSAVGARGALRGVPPGFGDGAGLLFALAEFDRRDALVLVLERRHGSWKAVGLVRR